MGQRITRAKGKIKAARIPYRVPSSEDLPARISGVLAVLFLVFNEGYLASDPGKEAVRSDLTLEAIRLTRLLQALLPSDGEVAGLVALMLLTEARRPARISTAGELVTLDEQDRGAWDAALIAEGHALVRERIAAVSAGQGHPGRYQILAAINAGAHLRQGRTRHRLVPGRRSLRPARRHRPLTDRRAQSARRARRARRAEVALAEVDRLDLSGYHAYHATRADLLRRLGRSADARAAYEKAIELAGNTAEVAYLTRRRDQLGLN